MCKLVVSGLALFFAGMYWNWWVDACKFKPLLDSLFITVIATTSFVAAFSLAVMLDFGLNAILDRIQSVVQKYKDALDYMAECKRKEVSNDGASDK